MKRQWGLLATLLLAACGKPNASGIYTMSDDQAVVMVQLAQDDQGKLTGRVASSTIGSDGVVSNKDAMLEGSISDTDLMLHPRSAWLGGLEASGKLDGDRLILVGNDYTIDASHSTLADYQAAVTKLQQRAIEQRQSSAAAKNQAASADRLSKFGSLVGTIRQQTKNIADGVTRSPDFGKMAEANTKEVMKLLSEAKGQSELARRQLAVLAGQVRVKTRQTQIARSQYANDLNNSVRVGEQAMSSLEKMCEAGGSAEAVSNCRDAQAVISQFRQTVGRASAAFRQYEVRVEQQADQQSALQEEISV